MGFSVHISFLSIILVNLINLTIAQPNFNYFNCTTSANYTANSTYKANLDTLLSSLSSNPDRFGFNSSSIGQDPDTVHAIALCRGDLALDICQNCITDSVRRLTQDCPNEKEAIGWYDLCMLRYSNQPINGTFVWGPAFYKYNENTTSDVDRFNVVLRTLLDGLRDTAASGSSRRKYASGEAELPSFQTLYALVQCTPDLSGADCSHCLNVTAEWIPSCCNLRIGAGIYRPSCNIRYEMDRFYNQTLVVEPPPPSDSPLSPPDVQLVPSGSSSNRTRTIIVSVVPTVIFLSFLIFLSVFLKKKKPRKPMEKVLTEDEISILQSLQYDLDTIAEATEDFSESNKLGQGGFGAVYKGRLPSGQEIAVKRLSLGSGQGEQEFKTEILLVAKLQHRNLVRLVGFCLEGVERLLIYEFVINGSLDHFIFDSIKRADLDWEKRYKIIEGVARGLLYLHEDSRLRIIHRDLKASNVLLDAEMVPKISDFGLARLFELDETQGTTSKIVGTFGYMAPEYAMHGHFSVKSDVFSFGVLVLEIVSGHKNTCFQDGENTEDLLSYAWKLWKEGTASDLIEPKLKTGSGSTRELMRCIHIGLLCVQENVNERPTMASVILMLSSLSLTLAIPSKPAFFLHSTLEPEMSLLQATTFTANEASITDLSPR